MRISDWSSDVCSSDLVTPSPTPTQPMFIAMPNQDYGPVLAQVKGLVEDHMVPKPIVLVDPVTGSEAPGYASGSGISPVPRSEEHTSELQSLMRISYAVLCLKNKNNIIHRYKYISNDQCIR